MSKVTVRNKSVLICFFISLFLVSGITSFSFPQPPTAKELLTKGKKLYDTRADGSIGLKAKPETINSAITTLEQAYALGANVEETGLYLIRCYNYKGRFACSNKSERKSTFEKGKNLGETLLKKYPDSAPLLFEYICVLGLWGNEIGALKAGWDGMIGKMKTSTEKLISIDPYYSGCAGERILGYMYLKAPYIPLVLTWPDNKKGLSYLEKVIKCSPYDFGTVFYYAEALNKNGNRDKAKEYMKKVTSMTPRKELYLEDLQFKEDAEKMLAEWK